MTDYPKNDEAGFESFLVREYFKHGTVEEVMRRHKFSLPVSYSTYQRILDNWGVIKNVGPDNKLNEAIDFLSHLAHDSIPFEALYKKMPVSFQTSTSTLYRIYSYVKEGITRRVGTALVITPYNRLDRVLLGRDVSAPSMKLGKSFGSLSLPMGYSRKRDSRKISIERILQQEVFSEMAIKREFPHELLSVSPEPFMYLDIADVRVAVYHLQLTKRLSRKGGFSSYKLKDHGFMDINRLLDIKTKEVRAGVNEALIGFRKYQKLYRRNLKVNPLQESALLNKELATIEINVED